MTRIAPLLLALALATGCCRELRPAPGDGAAPTYPWRLRDPHLRPFDFMWRQTVTATFGGRTASFSAVLQQRDGSLTLVGLTPFGSRAFVLRQVGRELTYEATNAPRMPFPPEFVMIDVQRTYLPFAAPPTDATTATVTTEDGERVNETWRAGTLRERTFERLDGRPAGRITITYEDWVDGAPRRVLIDNGWFGYRMEVLTTEATRL